MSSANFEHLHAAMRSQVDQQYLPGVSYALLRGREVVDRFCYGHADREASIPLREDHIFRIFSNTKLITSCAALLLYDEGKFGLDDPIETYIPELGDRQVLCSGATRIDDTEAAKGPITIRHLMTHTSGLSYGIFDPGSVMFQAYNQAGVLNPTRTLTEQMTVIGTLPLSFHPGTQWQYSVATDVVARLVEVVSGERFGAFLARRIFGPLGMHDTDFWVPPEKRERFCALYVGADLLDPMKPGLSRLDSRPYPGAYLARVPNEAGGGGLVSTLDDTVKFLQSLLPGGPNLLKPQTMALMGENQLPAHLSVQFANMPPMTWRGFGLGSAIAIAPDRSEPANVVSEVGWGGLAGTIWWYNPRMGIAAVLMTQRHMGFGNPYTFVFKKEAYKALGC